MQICPDAQVSIVVTDGCGSFCSSNLDLDPMTFMYKLDTNSPVCEYELRMSMILKVTDR